MTAVVSGEIQYVRDDGTLTYEGIALLQDIIAGSGGGGGVSDGDKGDITVSGGGTVWTIDSGAVSWAEVGGKPTVFPPDAHTHVAADVTDFAEAVDDRVAALLVAGSNVTLTYNDAANTLTVAATGGGGASGLATVTVPNNRLEWSETVTATGVTPSQRIMLTVGAHTDADENTAEMLDIAAMSATAGTNQISLEMAFSTPTAGPIKINWMAV